ncbi:hypothetical protein [Pleionea sp. CnH1-48]|uniref:hypothetical protein n=1 Tax=Pleionea sp. CnH1-48 TaxID=2954494 RepID=UPI002096FE26|nr:hypothetical protein [Pleionea sp. CnH1-48]MCO7225266.1 hypothetical protein [Pleionea sp. CnH1-48]
MRDKKNAAGSLPGSLYVMDFQGASSDVLFLYKLDHAGTRSRLFDAPTNWTVNQSPRHIIFGGGGDFGADLYVADNYTGNPQVWRIVSDGSMSKMFKSGKLNSLTSIRFGQSGPFGNHMYILDISKHQLLIADAWRNTDVFASKIDGTSFSDMVFSKDGRTLYLGLGDTVYAIKADKCLP